MEVLSRRLKCAAASGSRVQLNRKDRQHGVADEFEDLAAARFDRATARRQSTQKERLRS
jgi:hypothetical protein